MNQKTKRASPRRRRKGHGFVRRPFDLVPTLCMGTMPPAAPRREDNVVGTLRVPSTPCLAPSAKLRFARVPRRPGAPQNRSVGRSEAQPQLSSRLAPRREPLFEPEPQSRRQRRSTRDEARRISPSKTTTTAATTKTQVCGAGTACSRIPRSHTPTKIPLPLGEGRVRGTCSRSHAPRREPLFECRTGLPIRPTTEP
jgi:hypothetical protein